MRTDRERGVNGVFTGRRKGELTAAGIFGADRIKVTVPDRLHRCATGITASSTWTSGGSSSAFGDAEHPRNSAPDLATNDSCCSILSISVPRYISMVSSSRSSTGMGHGKSSLSWGQVRQRARHMPSHAVGLANLEVSMPLIAGPLDGWEFRGRGARVYCAVSFYHRCPASIVGSVTSP
jgi:hypothetical protein